MTFSTVLKRQSWRAFLRLATFTSIQLCTSCTLSCTGMSELLARFQNMSNGKPYRRCYPEHDVCWLTYGSATKLNLAHARWFCDHLTRDMPHDSASTLPILSSTTLQGLFDRYLYNGLAVTKNEPVWLDLELDRKNPHAGSLTVYVILINVKKKLLYKFNIIVRVEMAHLKRQKLLC